MLCTAANQHLNHLLCSQIFTASQFLNYYLMKEVCQLVPPTGYCNWRILGYSLCSAQCGCLILAVQKALNISTECSG